MVINYERLGLVPEPRRTNGGTRVYTAADVERVAEIIDLKAKYLRLTSIKEHMERPRESGRTRAPATGESCPGRPEAPGERTAGIIDCAIQVFSKKGYYNTKMSDIAESLGCSVGTIYIYFTSKKQLLLAAVDSVIAMMIERASNVDKSVADPIERTKAKGLFFAENTGHVRDIMCLLQAEAIGEDVEFSGKAKELFSEYAWLVAQDLELAVEKKYIRDTNTEIVSYCLLGIAWMLGSRLDWNDDFSGEELLDVAADALLNGLLSRPPKVGNQTESN